MARRKQKFATQTPDIVRVFPKTDNQQLLMESIQDNPITIASGCAGTGKTLISLHEAVQMHHKRQVEKILYIKPNIQITYDKGVGFLPGTVEEKLDPLLAPIKDNLEVFCSKGKAKQMIDNKDIEVQLLEYIRGRSLRNTFVIVDETQNLASAGVLTVLSRAEKSTKVVLLGDPAQKDSYNKVDNGLVDAIRRLSRLEHIVGTILFTSDDIQRSPYLKEVIDAYSL